MEQDCGLDGCFDVKISGEMFEESKPNPEIYLHTAQALGVKPAECLAIEDSSYGIEAARRAGMKSLRIVMNATVLIKAKQTALLMICVML